MVAGGRTQEDAQEEGPGAGAGSEAVRAVLRRAHAGAGLPELRLPLPGASAPGRTGRRRTEGNHPRDGRGVSAPAPPGRGNVRESGGLSEARRATRLQAVLGADPLGAAPKETAAGGRRGVGLV